jgi:hypothetical protein
LLGAYARCLKRQLWPTFDVLTENISQAWSGVSREMWMSEADARASTFFGVDAGLALAAN